MKVSIILTVVNEGPGLAELLDALLGQTTPADEIVIVDGGSRDDTLERLHAYAAKTPQLRIHEEPGVNIARGRNLAIQRSTGDIIAVTDGGCRPEPTWLQELIAPFNNDPAVGAVGGRFIPAAKSRFEEFCGLLSVPDLGGESQRGMFYGRSSAFRKSLWERVGGYPEWLYTGEDTLFAISAGQLTDCKIVYAPKSVLYWRPRPTLWKMAKMFYLYGRGNGRIQHGSLKGCFYWLRYYLVLVLSLLAAPWQPWLLLVTGVVAWHLYRTIVRPNLLQVEAADGRSPDRLFHVPTISLTRNLATNLGFLRGWLEHKQAGGFKERLEDYLKASRAPAQGSQHPL